MMCCFYTKILKRNVYNFHKGTFDLCDKRYKFYYENLIKKIQTILLPICINRLFNIGRENWKDIYERKVKNMYDKRLMNLIISC